MANESKSIADEFLPIRNGYIKHGSYGIVFRGFVFICGLKTPENGEHETKTFELI